MKTNLNEYTNEILDIARAFGVSYDIGKDMFLTNIRNVGEPHLPYYDGAEHVDYGALVPYLKEMEQYGPGWVKAYRENIKQFIALRREKDYDGVVALMMEKNLPPEEGGESV